MRRIFLQAEDYHGTGYFRAILPARYLTDILRDEHDIALIYHSHLSSWQSWDAYVFHRAFTIQQFPFALTAKSQGAKIVLETDDDIRALPNWSEFAEKWAGKRDMLELSLEVAHRIFASTEPLAAAINASLSRGKDLAKPITKAVYTPNLIEPQIYPEFTPQQQEWPVRILWAGSPSHREDLEMLIPAIDAVTAEYGDHVEFWFMGYCHPEIVRRFYPDRIKVYMGVPLQNYIKTVAVNIAPHIVLAPLAKCLFNESKSPIRWMESVMCNAAVIASDFGPYSIIRDGIDGVKVALGTNWTETIISLVADVGKRNDLVEAARARVLAEHSWASRDAMQPWIDAYTGLFR